MEEHSPKETDHPFEANPIRKNRPTETEVLRRKNGLARDVRTWKYAHPETSTTINQPE